MTDAVDHLRQTAYHESGHAVAAWVLGLGMEDVSIVPGEGSLGRVIISHIEGMEVYEETLRSHIVCYYAGVQAIETLVGQPTLKT